MAKVSPALRRGVGSQFATPVGVGDAPATSAAIDPIAVDPPSNIHHFPPAVTAITLVAPAIEAIDQLWDWVRADRDGTTAFLRKAHAHSVSFREQIAGILAAESKRAAWFRAIKHADELRGFLLIDPIAVNGATLSGHAHLYIAPEYVEGMAAWLPDVFAALPDMTVMMVDTGVFAPILAPLGFESATILTRPVHAQAVTRDRT